MDAAEYKHVVLGLIFLKYISDAFKEVHEDIISIDYSNNILHYERFYLVQKKDKCVFRAK